MGENNQVNAHGAASVRAGRPCALELIFMTIQEMYDMFLLEQEFRNNSPVTISWYKDQLTEFFKWLGSEDPADLNLLKFKQ